jgi:hypothetical protein
MKRIVVLGLMILLFVPQLVQAEFLRVQLKIYGMD